MSNPTIAPGTPPVNNAEPDALDLAIRDAVRKHSADVWLYEGETALIVADMWVEAHRDILRAIAQAALAAFTPQVVDIIRSAEVTA